MKRLVAASLLAGVGTACAPQIDFNSPSPLGVGVAGKSWGKPALLDSSLYIATSYTYSDTPGNGFVNSFDLSSYPGQSTAQLVGSWWDSSTTDTYYGHARLYTDGTGWASLGPNFAQIGADDPLVNAAIRTATVAAGPNGLYMANFFTDAGFALDSDSAAYTGSGWQLGSTNSATTTAMTAVPLGGSMVASAIDALGRGFLFFADAVGAGGVIRETQWGLANPTGIAAATNSVSSTGVAASPVLTARYDGSKHVCATFEDSSGRLKANCQDITKGGPYTFLATNSTTIATGVVGHDTATDGAGNIMTVFYKGSTTSYSVYAFIGAAGSWPTTATQVDAVAAAAGYTAPWPASGGTYGIDGARPGVAYVGSGRYLAVWVGVNTSLSPPATQLYSALYDPTTGWAEATAISGTYDAFTVANATPHPRAITVFGNGDGNAGYALNKIYTTEAVTGTATNPNIYPEDAQVRVTEVNRWHVDNGWLGATTYTDYPCFKKFNATDLTSAATGSGADADCTHRPLGVIFPSGNTVVVFQAIDGRSSGANPGNRRLVGLEFK